MDNGEDNSSNNTDVENNPGKGHFTLGSTENGSLSSHFLGLFLLLNTNEIEGGNGEAKKNTAHGASDTEDLVEDGELDGDEPGQERPDEGFKVTSPRRSGLLEHKLIEGDESGVGKDGVGEHDNEGVGELHVVQNSFLILGEVGEKGALNVVTVGKISEGTDDEVNGTAREEGDGRDAVHLLDLGAELGVLGNSQFGSHLGNVDVAAQGGEEDGDGATETGEGIRQPVVFQTTLHHLTNTLDNRNNDEQADAEDSNGRGPGETVQLLHTEKRETEANHDQEGNPPFVVHQGFSGNSTPGFQEIDSLGEQNNEVGDGDTKIENNHEDISSNTNSTTRNLSSDETVRLFLGVNSRETQKSSTIER